MDEAYHWPSLASAAKTVQNPKFRFEELCNTQLMPYRAHISESGYSSAVSDFGNANPGAWQGRETVLQWPGDPSDPHGPDGGREQLNELVGELGQCSESGSGVTVKIDSENMEKGVTRAGYGYSYAQATLETDIEGTRVTAHEYIVWTYGSCALAELALWSNSGPSQPWTSSNDDTVLDALAKPLKSASRCVAKGEK